MPRPLQIGDIITARFPLHTPPGHEQEGTRPAVVLGLPEKVGTSRFPMLLLAPLTTDRGQAWAKTSQQLYIRLGAKVTGLSADSIVLLEQVRSLDLQRVRHYIKALTVKQYEPIKRGLALMTELEKGE